MSPVRKHVVWYTDVKGDVAFINHQELRWHPPDMTGGRMVSYAGIDIDYARTRGAAEAVLSCWLTMALEGLGDV